MPTTKDCNFNTDHKSGLDTQALTMSVVTMKKYLNNPKSYECQPSKKSGLIINIGAVTKVPKDNKEGTKKRLI